MAPWCFLCSEHFGWTLTRPSRSRDADAGMFRDLSPRPALYSQPDNFISREQYSEMADWLATFRPSRRDSFQPGANPLGDPYSLSFGDRSEDCDDGVFEDAA